MDTKRKWYEKIPLFAYPSLYYTPETRWAIGLNALSSFKLHRQDSCRKSLIVAFFNYTQNQQFILQQTTQVFTHKEKFNLRLSTHLSHFPEYYYGIGDSTNASHRELVDYHILRIEARFLYQVTRFWFTGMQYRFVKQYQMHLKPNGLMESSQIAGYNGSTIAGLGLMLVHDSRDNIANAKRGMYVESIFLPTFPWLGSQYNYQNCRLDFRKFHNFTLTKANYSWVLAWQIYANWVFGKAPYKQLSELGGESLMRGYYRGRYRDKHLLAGQVEMRLPLVYDSQRIDWVGFATFVGVGNVWQRQIILPNFKTTYGVGLRIKFSPKDNLNFRIDYALSHEGGLFYIELGEAF
ncbi:MAG: outer membrane protein assembly factor [Microscillaceae bacterium]|nr:outer membrane protein assembly factor [Microscillaceae bacterium]MDW8460434.1 BamA/TamA family outer membrane protein [Cytophagales bacterium]